MTHSFIQYVRLVIKTYVKMYFAFVLLELEKNYYHTFIHFPSLFLIFWKSSNTSFINNLPPNIKTYFAFSFITFARKAKFSFCVFFCLLVRPSVRPITKNVLDGLHYLFITGVSRVEEQSVRFWGWSGLRSGSRIWITIWVARICMNFYHRCVSGQGTVHKFWVWSGLRFG